MKNTIIAVLAAFLIFALGSCDKDFLEKNPPLKTNESDIFTNQDRIESAVLGLYAQLKNTQTGSFMGGLSYVLLDARGEDFQNTTSNVFMLSETYKMNTTASSLENFTTWQQAYLAINDANIFLERLEGAKVVAGNLYDQYKSEALFVRGFAYYYLNMLYGMPYKTAKTDLSVPLRLKAALSNKDNNLACSTVDQVFQQILTDLSAENLASLPLGDQSVSTVTRATRAAAHMLKMRVFMAMENWNDAITEGLAVSGYSLSTDVSKLYDSPFYTTETIFSFPMADNNNPNVQQSVWEYYSTGDVMVLDTIYGVCSKAGYYNRADARISKLTGKAAGVTILKKMKSRTAWVPIYRYAETLLNLAECYANVSGGEVVARNYLKQVRRRSLVNASDVGFSDVQLNALTGVSLKEAIYNERRLEFLGEGIRDLDKHRRAESYVKPGINVTTSNVRSYVWPLPQAETSVNKLAQ